MINLTNVNKSFNKVNVINSITLKIENNQTHILLGSSGCGKTTILRMISSLTKPDSGTIEINGKSISDMPRRERSDLIGYVVQEGGLFPHLTAEENILLPAKIRNLDLKPIKQRMHDLSHMVHLQLSFLQKYPHQLSGGQRQRVSLLRGLILDPEIILLDEPLSALDPVVRMKLQKELKDIFIKLKKTVVMVTHDLYEASYLGDMITLLDKGRIVQQGEFSSILNNPKNEFVEDFINAQVLQL